MANPPIVAIGAAHATAPATSCSSAGMRTPSSNSAAPSSSRTSLSIENGMPSSSTCGSGSGGRGGFGGC
eukprot:1801155-Prymnesium_polylepis.1